MSTLLVLSIYIRRKKDKSFAEFTSVKNHFIRFKEESATVDEEYRIELTGTPSTTWA